MNSFLVVIPLYNKSSTILRAIESVLAQVHIDFKILIIDDGSTDDSYQQASLVTNDHITLIKQENHGVSYTRNIGIKEAIENKFDFVAFLDADDYWMPDHLKQLDYSISKFPDATIIANNYKIKIGKRQFQKTKLSLKNIEDSFLVEPFFQYNYLNTVLIPSAICMSVKNNEPIYFDENLSHTEDIDFLIKAGLSAKVAFHKNPTVIYDETAGNKSSEVPIVKRSVTNFSKYEKEYPENLHLKKLIDINRFSIAIDYRLLNDIKNATLYQHQIDQNNLTKKQRTLLEMSSRQLKALKRTQRVLGNLGFRLRTGS
ncbi:glycosyltransferase family A protein [Nonlabens antarcticus]|uniref:glycosyltransferase family A protein n=1 Tax=Nonlabens antarcticus TaxID=392714 RepID=UPI001891C7DE|nr:glycosyltransferase family 2 protein [Nonlabens antarcticus]